MTMLTTKGMHHLALFISNFDKCIEFYTKILNMKVEWQPDADNIYLTSGNDNLALHRAKAENDYSGHQRLDHLGFIVENEKMVDAWHQHLVENNVVIKTSPKTHRDGARSFYCLDPDNNMVQIIYHPPIAGKL